MPSRSVRARGSRTASSATRSALRASTSSSACCHGRSRPAGSGGAMQVRQRRVVLGERAVARDRRAHGDDLEPRQAAVVFVELELSASQSCAASRSWLLARAARRDSPGRPAGTRCPASPRAARARAACTRSPSGRTSMPHRDVARHLVRPRDAATATRPQARSARPKRRTSLTPRPALR